MTPVRNASADKLRMNRTLCHLLYLEFTCPLPPAHGITHCRITCFGSKKTKCHELDHLQFTRFICDTRHAFYFISYISLCPSRSVRILDASSDHHLGFMTYLTIILNQICFLKQLNNNNNNNKRLNNCKPYTDC